MATRTALTIAVADDEPWLMRQRPVDAEEHRPAGVVRVEGRVERQERRDQHLAGRLRLVVGAEGAEDRVHEGAHRTLEGLEHDVAGEAVGDDDIDVGRHDVAALDVADERAAGGLERLEPRRSALVSFTSGVPLDASSPIDRRPTRGCSMA